MFSEILGKYRINYLANKQKTEKNNIFLEKKRLEPLFRAKKQIFFVILRTQKDKRIVKSFYSKALG